MKTIVVFYALLSHGGEFMWVMDTAQECAGYMKSFDGKTQEQRCIPSELAADGSFQVEGKWFNVND